MHCRWYPSMCCRGDVLSQHAFQVVSQHVLQGGLLPGGLLLVPGGVPGGDPPDGYCCGQYASYWNAFLLILWSCHLKQNNFSNMIRSTTLGFYFGLGGPPWSWDIVTNTIYRFILDLNKIHHISCDLISDRRPSHSDKVHEHFELSGSARVKIF